MADKITKRKHIRITQEEIVEILQNFKPIFKCRYDSIYSFYKIYLGFVLEGRSPPHAGEEDH
jgi:hypothetical protein